MLKQKKFSFYKRNILKSLKVKQTVNSWRSQASFHPQSPEELLPSAAGPAIMSSSNSNFSATSSPKVSEDFMVNYSIQEEPHTPTTTESTRK